MRRCLARTGRQRKKAPHFESHLYNILAFSPISLTLPPQSFYSQGKRPDRPRGGLAASARLTMGAMAQPPSVTGLMPPPPPEADPAYRTRPGSGWTNMPVDSNT